MKKSCNMATKLLLRFALLLSLAAIVMSMKVGVDPSKPIEKAKDKAKEAKDKADDEAEEAEDEAEEAKDDAEDEAGEAKDDAEDEAEEAKDEAEEAKDEDPTSGSGEEKGSGSKEEDTKDSAEDKDKDDDDDDTESEETTTKASKKGKTTPSPKEKADIKAIEKLILSSTYKRVSHTKDDEFDEFLKAMGYSKIDQATIRNSPLVDISFSKRGVNEYDMYVSAGFMFGLKSFTLGKEFTDTLFGLKKCQSTITFEGGNKLIKKEKHTGFKCHHVFEFSREDLTINLNCKGKKATLEFEKK